MAADDNSADQNLSGLIKSLRRYATTAGCLRVYFNPVDFGPLSRLFREALQMELPTVAAYGVTTIGGLQVISHPCVSEGYVFLSSNGEPVMMIDLAAGKGFEFSAPAALPICGGTK